MRSRTRKWVIAGGSAWVGLLTLAIGLHSPVSGQASSGPRYATNGELLAPAGYETWVFVGSNLGLAYKPDLPVMTEAERTRGDRGLFHNVYVDPAAYAHFKATKTFPDPTILVMELFTAVDREPKGILAGGSFNGPRVGIEVAVKNSRRPDNSSTVWAYYDFTDGRDGSAMKPSAPAFADRHCEHCHRDHAGLDRVWVQFYPALRRFLPKHQLQ